MAWPTRSVSWLHLKGPMQFADLVITQWDASAAPSSADGTTMSFVNGPGLIGGWR
jgi:hypothetical protein